MDEERTFASNEFIMLSKNAGIEVNLSNMHSHNAHGVGERYQEPIR